MRGAQRAPMLSFGSVPATARSRGNPDCLWRVTLAALTQLPGRTLRINYEGRCSNSQSEKDDFHRSSRANDRDFYRQTA